MVATVVVHRRFGGVILDLRSTRLFVK